MNIINQSQAMNMLNNTLKAQVIKCYTFDINASYSNDLSSIYYDDFLVEWKNKIIKHDHYMVLFASEDIKNAPYYKASHLKKMNKPALYDLCEQYEILNYHYSDYDYDENTKQNLIDEIMRYVDNEKYYEQHYNESRYKDLDYDFRVTGHCQGDVVKVKSVGTEKEFLKHSYLPTSESLTNLFYNSPIQGYITVSCNDEELTEINFHEVDHFNEYDSWDKEDFLDKVKNTDWIVKLEYFDLLIEYLESKLPTSLGYDY
ncbi:TPA: hypothetical protein NNT44_004661 [Salmonella enterica]|nr:hypothetical protein [Salmonella enterica]